MTDRHAYRGLFISFEGTEGSGKTTQLRLLAQHLKAEGWPVTENQEPGGTPIGRQIRRILLDPANAEMAPMTELLLMFASRAQAAAQVILPALVRGDIVLSDRFTDSSLAYQGQARGLGFDQVLEAHKLALGSLQPNLTICVSVDLEEGLARAHGRNRDRATEEPHESRIDSHSLAFHRRVLEGYDRLAELEPERFHMVDGTGDPDAVAERIWSAVSLFLSKRRPEKP